MIWKISMKQSEIWLIDLDPTKGAEIQKKRPAIVVNDNRLGKLPLKIIMPHYRLEGTIWHCSMDDKNRAKHN